jgi:hypothetical protein
MALEIGYASKDTIKPLLQRAHQKADALSVGAAVPTKETIGDLNRKANARNDQPKTVQLKNLLPKA